MECQETRCLPINHTTIIPTHENLADVKKKTMDNFGVQKEYNAITNNLRKGLSKKSCGTPMKMLIAQEILIEPQSKQKPSNVVAKLMGLESLPIHQSIRSAKRSSQDGYLHHSLALESGDYWDQEDGSCQLCAHENECKEIHEVQQQPSRNTRFKDRPPPNRRQDENPTEKRLSLVYQKFTEAKRLATGEKLLQSKEFQQALKVLNSNKDLFLKFLEKPNAKLLKNLMQSQAMHPASQPRRITVLKLTKMAEAKGEAQERELLHPAIKGIDRSISVHHEAENISQPTRIVVLKPSLGMPHELKSGLSSPITISHLPENRDCYGCLGLDEATDSREIAKDITRRMQKYVSSHQKDEILDDSSLNGLETNYTKEECGNLSDSESFTLTSRHSFDYNFRLESPHLNSSCSLEPTVIKEAKRRLSKRLAIISSKETSQDQSQMQRSGSTLGDMLAFREVQREKRVDNFNLSSRRSYGGEKDDSTEGCSQDLSRNLERSQSLPISSSICENIGLIENVSESTINRSIVPKEVIKSKSGMSSFKGKVMSLFLSRIKKASRGSTIPSCFLGLDYSEASQERNDASSEFLNHYDSEGKIVKVSSSSSTLLNGPKQGISVPKASLSLEKSRQYDYSKDNQDEPGPISVLEAPFQDDANNSIFQPSASIISGHPQALSRSPPIGSISRTLTYEKPGDIPLENSLKLSIALSRECKEQERYLLVQKLLSYANFLDNSKCSNVLVRWHSLDSPLDPVLLEEFLDNKEEDAKCRERRSNQWLLFDCVNAALLSIGQTTLLQSYQWTKAYGLLLKRDQQPCSPVAEEVLKLVKDWFSFEEGHTFNEAENQNFLVDKLVKGEIAGIRWAESMCLEVDEFSREIVVKVLEELVEEALADLTDGCL